jgi:hypothetical protein
MRGALTVGNVHVDEQMIFGPALIAAYELESHFATYPRIVIDPKVFKELARDPLLKKGGHDLRTEKKYLSSLLKRDADGLYFVDYLKGMIGEFDDPSYELEFVLYHKKFIVAAAKGCTAMGSVAAKYLWLANYHNAFVTSFDDGDLKKCGLKRKDIAIAAKDMALLYDL